jgi:glycine betaine/proline transport system permease protein
MNDYTPPRLPLGEGIEAVIDFLVRHLSGATNTVARFIESALDLLVNFMSFFPAPVIILFLAVLAWAISGRWGVTIFTIIGLSFIWTLHLWDATLQTLALVVLATLIAIVIGIPLGIAAALFEWVHVIITPILDFMQTLPAFVYLIPAIPFFGLGVTSAIFSTVIFSMPPAIRMTDLGIRQVAKELIEAGESFGSTRRQILFKVQLPMAAPSIRAGVNQTIMLALSMVVIAAMIGAKGLGGVVWKAIQRLESGMGFEAGIGIVIIAIMLDRMLRQFRTPVHSKTSA